MRYCNKCGSQIEDEAIICPKCGCVVDNETYTKMMKNNSPNGLKTAARIFNAITIAGYSIVALTYLWLFSILLGTTLFIIFLIAALPLSWCIPMAVHYSKSVKNQEPVSTGFKVCCLIFLNLIAGILMLIDND